MKVSVLLADKGTQNPQGTVNLLNLGWSQTVLQPKPLNMPIPNALITPPMVVAVFYEVEHTRCNHPIELILSLVTEDGEPVSLPGPAGPQPMEIRQQRVIQTPAGSPIATPGTGNTLLEIFPGLPLQPGGYAWTVGLDGLREDYWSASFRVLQPQVPPVFQLGGTPSTPPAAE